MSKANVKLRKIGFTASAVPSRHAETADLSHLRASAHSFPAAQCVSFQDQIVRADTEAVRYLCIRLKLKVQTVKICPPTQPPLSAQYQDRIGTQASISCSPNTEAMEKDSRNHLSALKFSSVQFLRPAVDIDPSPQRCLDRQIDQRADQIEDRASLEILRCESREFRDLVLAWAKQSVSSSPEQPGITRTGRSVIAAVLTGFMHLVELS